MSSYSTHGLEWSSTEEPCEQSLGQNLSALSCGVQNRISLGQLWPKRFLVNIGESEALNQLWGIKSTKSQSCRYVYSKFQVSGTDVKGITESSEFSMIVTTPSESAFFKKTQIWRFLCEEKRQSIVLTMECLVGDKGLKKKPQKRMRVF